MTQDAKDYRVTAALSYVLLLFLVPMAKKNSPFCQFHAKKGIVLFAAWIADDQRRGLVRPDVEPMLASRMIIAALDGLELQYLLAGGGSISAPLELYVAQLRST